MHVLTPLRFLCLSMAFLAFDDAALAADQVKVSGTILSANATARTISVKTANAKAQVVELEVSRKAKVTLDGVAATLEDLRVGQKADVTFEPTLAVATEIQATGAGEAAPEMANLTEINTKEKDFCPWLSVDGLTIYWVMESPGAEGEIWTAHRKDPGSLFTGKRQVGYGRHICVASDGLMMYLVTRRADGRQGDSIQFTKRRSTDDSFDRPHEVAELRSVNMPRNLFLSQDGLSLMFNEGSEKDGTFRLSMATRGSLRSRWEPPKALPITSDAKLDGLVLCPYVTSDGLTLFANVQNATGPRFVRMSRKRKDRPFDTPVFLALPDVQEFVGWSPRFVEATGELFFCSSRLSSNGNMNIWEIRNFRAVPKENRAKEGTPVPSGALTVKPTMNDLGSFTMNKGGRSWSVMMPEKFTKAEVIFYRGELGDLTLNAAWAGHLQINGKDVVRFKRGADGDSFIFHDSTTGTEYRVKHDYKRTQPGRYFDVTKYLRPGENSFYYYHEQRPDLPMGVMLRIYQD